MQANKAVTDLHTDMQDEERGQCAARHLCILGRTHSNLALILHRLKPVAAWFYRGFQNTIQGLYSQYLSARVLTQDQVAHGRILSLSIWA